MSNVDGENMFRDAKVVVTGGTGLVGRPLVELLLERDAHVVIASLDDPSLAHPAAEFRRVNLLYLEQCLELCRGADYVFHVAGIKGSPAMTQSKPASFFVPTILMNTNIMEAARRSEVRWCLYTSTVGVYGPAEIFREDDVWKTFPSEHDRFAGWAKRMGELQAEAYRIEHGWDRISIVRPANIYGPNDNFDPNNAMAIPSLIRRALEGENPLVVWGDGSAVRDFIHATDVARGMLLAVERQVRQPINLGSGQGVSIRQLVEVIVRCVDPPPRVEWDRTKPAGDRMRLMDISRARSMGFEPAVSLEDGIRQTVAWYRAHRGARDARFNVFATGAPV